MFLNIQEVVCFIADNVFFFFLILLTHLFCLASQVPLWSLPSLSPTLCRRVPMWPCMQIKVWEIFPSIYDRFRCHYALFWRYCSATFKHLGVNGRSKNRYSFVCTHVSIKYWHIVELSLMRLHARILVKSFLNPHFSLWRCHGAKPPPKPEFTLKPKKKKIIQQSESAPGTPCPPCPELEWRPCVGQHIGAERMVCLAYFKRSIRTMKFNILYDFVQNQFTFDCF